MENKMDFGLKIVVWYDRHTRLWTAIHHDAEGYQVGDAGYGSSKKSAINDLKISLTSILK